MARRTSIALICAGFALVLCCAQAGAATPRVLPGQDPSYNHVCALSQAGQVYCWGSNSNGELGSAQDSGTLNPVPTPQHVPLAGPASEIASGDAHVCALLTSGPTYCWGINTEGQLVNTADAGTITAHPTPLLANLATPAQHIFAGYSNTCFVFSGGNAGCAGYDFYGQIGLPADGATHPSVNPIDFSGAVQQIAVGSGFICALTATGAVRCLGYNENGALGNSLHSGTSTATTTPVLVGLGGPAIQLAAGAGHICAVLQDHSVYCWGANNEGQLGNGTTSSGATYTPQKVPVGAADRVAAGTNSTCVHLIGGGVDCWGWNPGGELGLPDDNGTFNPHSTPLYSQLDPSAAIEMGGHQTCYLASDGGVECVGANGNGELGASPSEFNYSYLARKIPGLNLFDVPAPAAAKLTLAPAKPRLKFKRTGARIAASSRVAITAASGPVPAAACAGQVKASFQRKIAKKVNGKRTTVYKRVVAKSFALGVKKGACGINLTLKLPRRTGGSKLYLDFSFAGNAAADAFDKRFALRIKKL